MDSITQAALGGAITYAVLGKRVGPKAALYGAALGTLPDLDVFLDFGGPVENFTFHRSFSHSLLVQLLVTPGFAWLFSMVHRQAGVSFKHWCLAIYLCFSTHSLLDACTVYGTQLLWPLTDYPFGVSNLFIIDPIYTAPLLVGFVATLVFWSKQSRAIRINRFGLILSTVYLGWSLLAKVYIDDKIQAALATQEINHSVYVSTPAPFTTLLWRAIAVDGDQYYEVFASVFDDVSDVSIDEYSRYPELLNGIEQEWGVRQLQAFTKGLYSVNLFEDRVVMSDLRMGIEGSYVFRFKVGVMENENVKVSDFEHLEQRPALDQAHMLYQRIFDPSISLSPAARAAASAPQVMSQH